MPDNENNNGQPVITLKGIRKVYGHGQASMEALRGVDLNINKGEFIAVMFHKNPWQGCQFFYTGYLITKNNNFLIMED